MAVRTSKLLNQVSPPTTGRNAVVSTDTGVAKARATLSLNRSASDLGVISQKTRMITARTMVTMASETRWVSIPIRVADVVATMTAPLLTVRMVDR